MQSSPPVEVAAKTCPICGERLPEPPPPAGTGACPRCGNRVALDGPETPPILLAAFPILDQQTQDVFDRIGAWAEAARPARLELDFAGVKFVSSAALSKLLMLAKKAASWGVPVVLAHLDPMITEVLEVTHLNKLFRLA